MIQSILKGSETMQYARQVKDRIRRQRFRFDLDQGNLSEDQKAYIKENQKLILLQKSGILPRKLFC